MNAVVLLSKTFFPQHPKAGQETNFREKVLNHIHMIEQAENCQECRDMGGGDCRTCYVPIGSNVEIKQHTCRINYEYWKKKIDKLKAEGGVLSVRQWSLNPYRSPQETIVNIPAEDVGIQRLELSREKIHLLDKNKFTYHYTAEVDGKDISINTLANNDGLHIKDFESWFAPVFKKQQTDVLYLAIIHFTKFQY